MKRLSEYDVNTLPKWGQQKIAMLERDLAAAQARLAAGPEDSDTFAGPYNAVPRPLGKGTRIRFGGMGYDSTFDVNLDETGLHVTAHTGSHAMAIVPNNSNTITVRTVPRVRQP